MNNYLDTPWERMRDDPFERIMSLTGKSPRTWSSAGAVFGLAGGVLAPALGTLLTVANWFTGKHASGYFTPGVVFKAGRKTTGYAGYSIGNQNASRGNHFFLLELGYNFN